MKLKIFLRKLVPPPSWRPAVSILIGLIIGTGLTAFHISNASSYLSDDPAACTNCHLMTPQYATWEHSSHGKKTNCNDCHVPHDNIFRKLFFKASDGMRHASMFTLRLEPQVIIIKEAGKSVVQENCIRCHSATVNTVYASNITGDNYKHGEGKFCWECHREVPHGRVSSQASTPYAKIPDQNKILPEELEKFIK